MNKDVTLSTQLLVTLVKEELECLGRQQLSKQQKNWLNMLEIITVKSIIIIFPFCFKD